MRSSLVTLGRRMPELAGDLERLADLLDRGAPDTLEEIRRLVGVTVTDVCIENKVQVEGLATTGAMLDALVARGKVPAAVATPLRALDSGELTLTGDAARALVGFLQWRLGSRSRTKLPRSRRPLVIGLVVAIAVFAAAAIVLVARRGKPALQASEMITIESATFEMGSTAEERQAELARCERLGVALECDEEELAAEQLRKVTVSAFEIDRREVTIGELAMWLARERPADAAGLPNVERDADGALVVKPERARLPATGVNWHVARAYCEAVGKRLPTEAEWELAARGVERRRYPWGSSEPACDDVVFGRRAGLSCETGGFPMEPAQVETAARDVTPDGVHDLGGNVTEWTADCAGERPWCAGHCVDPCNQTGSPDRVIRGGNFRGRAGWLRAAGRGQLDANATRVHIGFRCARTLPADRPR